LSSFVVKTHIDDTQALGLISGTWDSLFQG
jgi:hypothetical protein